MKLLLKIAVLICLLIIVELLNLGYIYENKLFFIYYSLIGFGIISLPCVFFSIILLINIINNDLNPIYREKFLMKLKLIVLLIFFGLLILGLTPIIYFFPPIIINFILNSAIISFFSFSYILIFKNKLPKHNNELKNSEDKMNEIITKNLIPEVCPHCKNPNTKRIRLCEWCGNQIV